MQYTIFSKLRNECQKEKKLGNKTCAVIQKKV